MAIIPWVLVLVVGYVGFRAMLDYVRGGGSALLLLGPTLGEGSRVLGTGLEPVLELALLAREG